MHQNDINALMSNYNSEPVVSKKPISIKLLVTIVISILVISLVVVLISLFSNRLSKYDYVSYSGNINVDNDIIQEIITTEGDDKSRVSLLFNKNNCELDIVFDGYSIIDYCNMSDETVTFYHKSSEVSLEFEIIGDELHLIYDDSLVVFKSS